MTVRVRRSRPSAPHVRAPDLSLGGEPIGDDAGPRARRHGQHVRIIGVENGNPVLWQRFGEPPFLYGRGFEAAKCLVVIAADGGDDPDLRPEESRLWLDPTRRTPRYLLSAEFGGGTNRQDVEHDAS
jgi:hypothetical protein